MASSSHEQGRRIKCDAKRRILGLDNRTTGLGIRFAQKNIAQLVEIFTWLNSGLVSERISRISRRIAVVRCAYSRELSLPIKIAVNRETT